MSPLAIVSAALVAAVSNLDNLTVGLACGLRGERVPAAPNTVIALITMAGTGGSVSLGRALSPLLPAAWGGVLGGSAIIAIGVWTAARARGLLAGRRGEASPAGRSRAMSVGAAIPLGFALAVNNVGTGVGAGVAGIPPLITTVLAGGASLLAVGGGAAMGRRAGALAPERWAPVLSGLTLVCIGTLIASGRA